MNRSPAALVKKFYDLRKQNDPDLLRSRLAPNVRWCEPEVGNHMGVLEGVDAVIDMVPRAFRAQTGDRLCRSSARPAQSSAMDPGLERPVGGMVGFGWPIPGNGLSCRRLGRCCAGALMTASHRRTLGQLFSSARHYNHRVTPSTSIMYIVIEK